MNLKVYKKNRARFIEDCYSSVSFIWDYCRGDGSAMGVAQCDYTNLFFYGRDTLGLSQKQVDRLLDKHYDAKLWFLHLPEYK